jgi:hypothetical protein
MPIHFFSFPSEIRNKIYEEALMLSEPIILWARQPYGGIYGLALPRNSRECGPLRLCPAILLANKRAHREASPLLYSRNCVRLQERAILTSFLDHIGPQNASFLRHICIPFPAFDDYHLGSVTLKEDNIRTRERIRDNCTNLATLETSLRFRIIITIESAIDFDIINMYDKPLSYDLREEMHGYG